MTSHCDVDLSKSRRTKAKAAREGAFGMMGLVLREGNGGGGVARPLYVEGCERDTIDIRKC